MFTGHYAPAFALKSRYPQVPLWQLFLAVQAVDILFFLLVPLGVERLRLDHSRPALLALQLEGMPWSHSLVMTVLYAALCVAWGIGAKKRDIGIAFGLAVLSHWFLDALVHVHDVPIAPGLEDKVGLGLWEHGLIAYLVETALVGVTGALLWRRLSGQARDKWLLGLVLLLIVIQTLNVFVVPLPKTVLELALVSEVSFLGFAAVAYGVESRMSRKTAESRA